MKTTVKTRRMHPALRVLLIVLLSIAGLAALAGIAFAAQYLHRSKPSAIKHYETTNPNIIGRTAITAHRSGAGIVPEELLSAFRYCVEDSDFEIDYFEFDLHLTKDEQLVLLHDDELDRTSNCEEVFGEKNVQVGDKTLEELRRLNMGAKFVNEAGEMPYANLTEAELTDDLRIATLDQVLDYLTSRGEYRYIIEVKDGGERGCRAVDLLYENLKARGLLERSMICSFIDEVLKHLDTSHPDALRCAATKEVAEFFVRAMINDKNFDPPYGALQIPFGKDWAKLSYYLNFGVARILNYAHERDISVQYWTINDEKDMEYLISIGADGIVTDYPNRMQAVLERMGR